MVYKGTGVHEPQSETRALSDSRCMNSGVMLPRKTFHGRDDSRINSGQVVNVEKHRKEPFESHGCTK